MAIFVSKTTPWNLSDVNSGFTSLASVLNVFTLARTSKPSIEGAPQAAMFIDEITFLSNDTLTGFVIPILNDSEISIDRDLMFSLNIKFGTCTCSISSPGIVTAVGHGLSTGDLVHFDSTGTLPTGITKSTVRSSSNGYGYFVGKINDNTFYLYNTIANAISGGSTGRFNFTGSQSGTHTLWKEIRKVSITSLMIKGMVTSTNIGQWLVDVPFSSGISVTTTANNYRLSYWQGIGTTAFGWGVGSNGTSGTPNYSMGYVRVGSTPATPVSGTDFLVIRGQMTIDMNWTLKAHLGTSPIYPYCGWVCGTTDNTFGNNVMVKWIDAPVDSYTLTSDGGLFFSTGAGFQIGSSNLPIPINKKAIISLSPSLVGTSVTYPFIKGGIYGDGRSGDIYCYGEIPLVSVATLSVAQPLYNLVSFSSNKISFTTSVPSWAINNELVSVGAATSLPSGLTQGTLYMLKNNSGLTFDLYDKTGTTPVTFSGAGVGNQYCSKAIKVNESTDWVVGEQFAIGLQDVVGIGDSYSYTIGDITADGKIFSHTVSGRQAYVGPAAGYLINAPVINLDRRGIKVLSSSTLLAFAKPGNHCYISGVAFDTLSCLFSANEYQPLELSTKFVIIDCVAKNVTSSILPNSYIVPIKGIELRRCYGGTGSRFIYGIVNGTLVRGGKTYTSGTVEVYDSTFIHDTLFNYSTTGSALGIKWIVSNVSLQNTRYQIQRSGVGSTYTNFQIFGCEGTPQTGNSTGVINYNGAINTVATNDKIDLILSTSPYYVQNLSSTVINSRIVSPLFDTIKTASATNYFTFTPSAYSQMFTIENSNKNLSIDTTNQNLITTGSTLTFLNWNSVTNDDRNYYQYGMMVRTGLNLGDTTTRSNNYAMRFQPNSGDTSLQYITKIPIGSIQGKDAGVGVWCKINSGNYYSGTYQMPRMYVIYDNATTVYAEAGQIVGSWQYLYIPFKPDTTYSEITVIFDTRTDATTSDSYVYFADFSTFFPAGTTLNLGSFNLWTNGSPISPYISTSISANDVWAASVSQNVGTGTMGKQLLDIAIKTDDNSIIRGIL